MAGKEDRLSRRSEDADALLRNGLLALGLDLEPDQYARLIHYLELLAKWNRVYNLTAIRDRRAMIAHHLLDSLAVLPYARGARLLDVGSGAGLPGLVLAVAAPELHCTLLDSSAKKTRFLTQAVVELRLDNVEVVLSRIEDFRPPGSFDTVVARAFADLAGFYAAAGRLRASGGCLLAMKGRFPEKELVGLPDSVRTAVHRLDVPALDAQRHLVIMEV